MKISDALVCLNPASNVEVIMKGLEKMSEREFRAHQEEMIKRAEQFAKNVDTDFSASLNDGEKVVYASVCQSFVEALSCAKRDKNNIRIIAAGALTGMIAWWHFLENLPTLASSD